MGAASAWVRSAPRITRHLAFVIPAAAERRSPPDAAGRGAFGNIIGEPTTDHAARYYKFESISLQRRVRELPISPALARRRRLARPKQVMDPAARHGPMHRAAHRALPSGDKGRPPYT